MYGFYDGNEIVTEMECDRNVLCISVIIIVSLFKHVNVESIHIEVGKESHKHSLKTILNF